MGLLVPTEGPEGREEVVCRQLLRLVPRSLLSDCFCATKERWFKRGGAWSTERLSLYRGYAFALSTDAAGHASVMDDDHVICSSTAVIVDGVLHVENGPLVGQEERVRRVDRRRKMRLVAVTDSDGGLMEQMPLDVPFKN